jgi:hypothetical protein
MGLSLMAYVTRRRARGSTRSRLVWGVVTGTALVIALDRPWLGSGWCSGEVSYPPVLATLDPLGQRSGWSAMRAEAVPRGSAPRRKC